MPPCSNAPYKRVSEAELPELMEKILTYEGDYQTRLALQFMALTFVRTSELRFAEWTEIDEKKKEWRIPPEKMKMRSRHIDVRYGRICSGVGAGRSAGKG